MSRFTEIRHNYMYGPAVEKSTVVNDDLLAAVLIDAWESDEYDAIGSILATVVLTRHGDIAVVYHDNSVHMDDDVTNHISEAKEDLRKVWATYNRREILQMRQSGAKLKEIGAAFGISSEHARQLSVNEGFRQFCKDVSDLAAHGASYQDILDAYESKYSFLALPESMLRQRWDISVASVNKGKGDFDGVLVQDNHSSKLPGHLIPMWTQECKAALAKSELPPVKEGGWR